MAIDYADVFRSLPDIRENPAWVSTDPRSVPDKSACYVNSRANYKLSRFRRRVTAKARRQLRLFSVCTLFYIDWMGLADDRSIPPFRRKSADDLGV